MNYGGTIFVERGGAAVFRPEKRRRRGGSQGLRPHLPVPGAAGSKILMVHFDDGRNDESYRVTATNKATAEEITNVLVTEAETTFTFADLAAGTLVDITVTGRNDKGESQPTDAVTAAVP